MKHKLRENVSNSLIILRDALDESLKEIGGRTEFIRRLWQKMFRYVQVYAEGDTGPQAETKEIAASKQNRLDAYLCAVETLRRESRRVAGTHRQPSVQTDKAIEALPLSFDLSLQEPEPRPLDVDLETLQSEPDHEFERIIAGGQTFEEDWDDDSRNTHLAREAGCATRVRRSRCHQRQRL